MRMHQAVVTAFADGWRSPHPQAWDDLLDQDVVLHQPMLADGRGLEVWHEELGRLLEFLPDLRGEVLTWAGRENVLFIDIVCRATAGGRPMTFRAVDRLVVSPEGTVLERDSFFDPLPLAITLAGRPTAWLRWWRSGVGPFLLRRKFLRSNGRR